MLAVVRLSGRGFHMNVHAAGSNITINFYILLFGLLSQNSPVLTNLTTIFTLHRSYSRSLRRNVHHIKNGAITNILKMALVTIGSFLKLSFSISFFNAVVTVVVLVAIYGILSVSATVIKTATAFLIIFCGVSSTRGVACTVREMLSAIVNASVTVKIGCLLPNSPRAPTSGY